MDRQNGEERKINDKPLQKPEGKAFVGITYWDVNVSVKTPSVPKTMLWVRFHAGKKIHTPLEQQSVQKTDEI